MSSSTQSLTAAYVPLSVVMSGYLVLCDVVCGFISSVTFTNLCVGKCVLYLSRSWKVGSPCNEFPTTA